MQKYKFPKFDLNWYMRSNINENGVLIRIPNYVQYYTPLEWFEALFDLNEITEHEVWYQDYVYAIAFYRYKFRKKKKYWEHENIRLHRKVVCKYIAPDPEISIYEGEKLEQWKKKLAQAVYESFSYQTRSASFRNIKVKGRCLNCSIILSETNRNSWRYCSEKCRDEFYLKYSIDYSRDYVFQRDKGICQDCKEEIKGEYDIDHIVEISTGETPEEQVKLFLDYTNMQTLCLPCHRKKTANFLRKRFTKIRKPKRKSKKIEEFL
jgi:5-methylcytosine-specific restriction endonuclease McrA